MLHFFKQKPFLTDLIPDNHIDIHSHLLPGIDDGAETINDAISLAKQMSAIGFKNIITTPHIMTNVWDNSEISIKSKYNETLKKITVQGHINSFKAAAEYMIDTYFLKRLEKEKLLTLKDNLILVEIPYLFPPLQLFEILFEIQLAGYKPVLAHPERYPYYHNNFSIYEKLKKSGCYFQLNLLSTVGYYGGSIATVTDKLLKNGFYDFVGSDIHHQNHIEAFKRKICIKNQSILTETIQKNLFFIK